MKLDIRYYAESSLDPHTEYFHVILIRYLITNYVEYLVGYQTRYTNLY